MKKVLILGSASMAGHIISRYLNSLNKYKIINIAEKLKLNKNDILIKLEDNNLLKKNILKFKPNIIINCIRLLIEESEENPALAVYYNSFIPHFLEFIGKLRNIKIIHLSTDCVFSGKKGGYIENDIKDGEGYYARTKALGEIINNKDLTIRTSFIGPDATNKGEELFHWFLTQKGSIQGFSRVFWTGITTLELAKAIDAFIEQNINGLYHLVPNRKISKFELLKLIQKIWNKNNVKIEENTEKSVDKSLINTRKDFNYEIKSYLEMFNELHDWMKKNKDLYKNKYQFV